MRYRPFGPAGRSVPVVGQGSYGFERDPAQAVRALRRGLDRGMTHVDTASSYGDGRVEEIVGRAIADRRDELFLVSKVRPDEASRTGSIDSCEASLRRLSTDRLDCLLLHWIGPHPFPETVAAFEELKAKGKILSWGVSNFDENELEKIIAVAGEGAIACNQVLYHLAERAIEHAVVPYCEAHQISVVAYSALGSGDFPSPRGRPGRVLAEIAEARGATPRQVALAFLSTRAPFLLVKSQSLEHVEENAAAADLDLEDHDQARIEAAFPRGPRRAGVPLL